MPDAPARNDLLGADTPKNWGKWGPNDEIGTLNYTSAEDIINAAKLVKKGKVTDEIVHIDATEEQERRIGQANEPVDKNGKLTNDQILCRTQAGHYEYYYKPQKVSGLKPRQLIGLPLLLETPDAAIA